MRHTSSFGCPEPLEARIAPATVSPVATAHWLTGQPGDVFQLHAGEGLSTAGDKAGAYLLYIEKGNALVFTTDLNNNGSLDENEITGIAAGDGLRIILFTDVHGDIATNLRESTSSSGLILTLTDSNNNAIDNDRSLKGDGMVILNNTIEKIEMRTLTVADLPNQNGGDGIVDDTDVILRAAPTSFSIFGNIYAGKGFGVAGDLTSGLIVDSSGSGTYPSVLLGATEVHPTIGSIKVGSAVSGEWLNFGVSRNDDIAGTLLRFIPLPGQHGADIAYVHSKDATTVFNLNSLVAGDGGVGAAGGNVVGVTLNADDSGGYEVIAGNGGRGPSGGQGGSITDFSDLGSHTGKVLVRSGTGGQGTTGVGGNAGDFTFKTINVYGFVSFDLGSGGAGFTAGGNGGSVLSGSFTQNITAYNAGETFGTYHQSIFDGTQQAMNIGTHKAIDFNQDGYGDMVYTTVGTSQLVIVLGGVPTGANVKPTDRALQLNSRIYLSGVRDAEALTVADFNGDGHLDIAVGSVDASNRSGIAVFLSKFEDLNNDGVLDSSEDLNKNGINDFLGFYDARWSTLPQLTGFDTNPHVDPKPYNGAKGLPFPVEDRIYAAGPISIGQIAAGDFDGDGKTELAVSANYSGTEVILFLTQDIERNDLTGKSNLTGQFYADYGAKEIKTPGGTTPPDPRKPYITAFSGGPGHAILSATALTDTADHDVLMVATRDLNIDGGYITNAVFAVDYQTRGSVANPAAGTFTAVEPAATGIFLLGSVDRNRLVGGNNIDREFAFPLDFTVVDFDNDGKADVVAITGETPGVGFMVASNGDGIGNGIPISGLGDQAGDFFGNLGYGNEPHVLSKIRSLDGDGDGRVDQVAVFGSLGPVLHSAVLTVLPGGNESSLLISYFDTPRMTAGGPGMADIYIPDTLDIAHPVVYSSEGSGNIFLADVSAVGGHTPAKSNFSNNQAGYLIQAGAGGNSIVGSGGLGGGFGSGSKLTNFSVTDPITGVVTSGKALLGSVQFQIDGTINLVAGKGGDGFAKGGKGGGIIGVVSIGVADVSLTAGNGGRGVSGAGGDGGSMAADSIVGGFSWKAGNGGSGSVGGKGGSIIGNQNVVSAGVLVPDTLLPSGPTHKNTLTVLAGNGGSGTRGGGNGGSISNFLPDFNGTTWRMEAGDGGLAVSGAGGSGGSIVNSSPTIGSIISKDIALLAGDGGGGLTGGSGGSVTNFVFRPPSTGSNVRPTLLSVIAGHGASGTSGDGGMGGSVTNVNVPTQGASNGTAFLPFNFNRVLAGNGGSSAGGNGGNGGGVFDIASSAGDAAYALVGGAGGDGLRSGGIGGNVSRAEVQIGSSTLSKLLVIAGAGGDASAFVPNLEKDPLTGEYRDQSPDQDKKSFGGVVGRGGHGGSITAFSQIGNIAANVDLIAGNGGSTLHYGTVIDNVVYAGRGGDITTVYVQGNIGNLDPDVAIKSYNATLTGESVAAFVENKIRTNLSKPVVAASLSNADGNVGIVVGSAGRIKNIYNPLTSQFDSQPATFADKAGNGDLIDLTASNILSAVAGSVDRLAVIHAARGVKVRNGIIGGDKGVIGAFDYLDKTGAAVATPLRDGQLIDGALLASAITDLAGAPVDLIGRVFKL